MLPCEALQTLGAAKKRRLPGTNRIKILVSLLQASGVRQSPSTQATLGDRNLTAAGSGWKYPSMLTNKQKNSKALENSSLNHQELGLIVFHVFNFKMLTITHFNHKKSVGIGIFQFSCLM